MNEPSIPTPNLENTPQEDQQPVSTQAFINQSVSPASSQEAITQESQAALPQSPIEQVSTASGKTILIVEDERFISELYTRALQKAGYQITTASDGEEAFQVATHNTFDLILLDIMLPTMNGVDLLYKMKDPGAVQKVTSKIIITTNMDQEESTKAKVEQMADGYLIKAEVTPKELVSYVKQVFGDS
jgi:CheY-like chemotaxis protein